MFFGKSAQQKRIDELVLEVAMLEADNADLSKSLRTELATNDALDRTARKYREERDSYKPDALKYRKSIAPLAAANERRRQDALNRAATPKATGAASSQVVA